MSLHVLELAAAENHYAVSDSHQKKNLKKSALAFFIKFIAFGKTKLHGSFLLDFGCFFVESPDFAAKRTNMVLNKA